MNIRMKRGAALILTAALLLAGSAQALFGLGKSKTDAPAPENAPAARDLEIRTYRGIPYQGQLEGTDPDGGDLTFAVVDQPKKGTVTVEGANFTYTPKNNAAGADSFTYPAANRAGTMSPPAVVTLRLKRPAPASPMPTRTRRQPPLRRIWRSRGYSPGRRSGRSGILSRIGRSAAENFWP